MSIFPLLTWALEMLAIINSMNNKKSIVIVATTLAASLLSTAAQAGSPAEAFQRAEHLGQMIERLLHSDLYESALSKDPAITPSRPRHVLRLASYAYENVQFLKSLNGLPEDKPINTAAKKVKPDDVIKVLDAAIASTKALAPVYKVDLNFQAPPITAKKTPGEVLARLRAVNKGLIKLGAPKALPNDVYRVSLGINEQAKAMTQSHGIEVTGHTKKVLKATPADALAEAISLINDLEKLSSSNKKFALPNGVATPPTPKKGDPVTPANVLLATQFALADTYSLQVTSGYTEDLILPPVQAGRNPADVKNILAEARLYINALSESN